MNFIAYACAFALSISAIADQESSSKYWMKLKADNAQERTQLLELGFGIEHGINDGYAVVTGTAEDLAIAKSSGKLLEFFEINGSILDFPSKDSNFHNYNEMQQEILAIKNLNPAVVSLETIGQSNEGRDLINIRLSADPENSHLQPGIVFMGTHHAREHLSTEIPLKLARYLVEQYNAQNPSIVSFFNSREINIIPMVNPDGVEWDISTGDYKMWRKNRSQNSDGTMGVDLNRNYGFGWGTGGSSNRGSSDVYMGPKPFSEPETQAIKNFVDTKENLTTLLSFHTFSELILYPWGGKDEPISNQRDRLVHETMANTMAGWNGYTPQKSSELYIASGDTTDWAYGEHGVISFTFELDPKSMWSGGFYPGQSKIQPVFDKNLQPCLYLIEHSDNPYRVLDTKSSRLGFQTSIFE